jgi:hypothetical protein
MPNSFNDILDDEHQGSIPDVLRVLFHVHTTTTNANVRELILAVYPAIGKSTCMNRACEYE